MRNDSPTAVRPRSLGRTFPALAWCFGSLRPRLPRSGAPSERLYVLSAALAGIAGLILCLLALIALLIPCLLSAVHLFVK